MEYALIVGAALVAFAAIALPILVWASIRRTETLRQALNAAMTRIDVLEAAVREGPLRDSPLDLPPAQERRALDAATAPPTVSAPPILTQAPPPQAPPSIAPEPLQPQQPPEIEAAAPPPPPAAAAAPAIIAPLCVAAAAASLGGGLAPLPGLIAAIAAGLAGIGAAEWLRRAAPASPIPAAALAGVGLAIITAAARWGVAPLNVLAPAGGFALAAACVIAALALALRHGALTAYAGVAIGACLPALFALGPAHRPAHAGLLFVMLIGAMIVAAARAAPALAWSAMAAAAIWGGAFAWSLTIGGAPDAAAVAGYAAALAALGYGYAAHAARESVHFPRLWTARWSESLISGLLLSGAGAAIIALTIARSGAAASVAAAGAAALMLISAGAALWRPGLILGALAAALAAGIGVLVWPDPSAADGAMASSVIAFAGAIALIGSLAGWALAARPDSAAAGALLAAFAPIGAVAAARIRLGAFGPTEFWLGAALCAGVLGAVAAQRWPRSPAATFFIAGAATALAASVWILAPPGFATTALCVFLIAIAAGDILADQRGLRLAAGVTGAAIAGRLIAPDAATLALFDASDWAAPITPHIFGAAMSFAVAGSLFAFRAERRHALAPQGLLAGAIALTCAAAVVWARRFALNAAAPAIGLEEIGLYASALLIAAIAFAWRFGSRATPLLFWAETAFVTVAAALTFIAGGVIRNPWWGLAPAPVYGGPGLNALAIAFGAPALLFLFYGALRLRQSFILRGEAALAAGAAALALNVVLELRRLFHGAAMATAPTAPLEGWTITLALLGFAGALLAWGFEAKDRRLRLAALALALGALTKSALFDLTALSGLTLISALALVLAGAAAMVFGFRRFAWGPPSRETLLITDPNLMPPR